MASWFAQSGEYLFPVEEEADRIERVKCIENHPIHKKGGDATIQRPVKLENATTSGQREGRWESFLKINPNIQK
jgi:hypothetical protein